MASMAFPLRPNLNPAVVDLVSRNRHTYDEEAHMHTARGLGPHAQSGLLLGTSHGSAPHRRDEDDVGYQDHARKRVRFESWPCNDNQSIHWATGHVDEYGNILDRLLHNNNNNNKNNNDFSIINAIAGSPFLILDVARQLDLDDLINLYAISRDFHANVNKRLTTVVTSQALSRAPESARTFPFRCYKSLCRPDPDERPHPFLPDQARFVPTFRWLRMVLYREKVVSEIIRTLATEGHRLPPRASLTIKRIWMTMDFPTNKQRIALIHNEDFWTVADIYMATMFFIKLDMRFADPVESAGVCLLRSLLMGQRSLTPLWKALRRTGLRNQLELLQMVVRYCWQPAPMHRGMSIMGVPADKVGRGCLEGWGAGTHRLLRPDELVIRESIRRRIIDETEMLEMATWGYVDHSTGANIVTPEDQMLPIVPPDLEEEYVALKARWNTLPLPGSQSRARR